jgi:cobalt-zinc-cadmium efflux system protein
MHPEGVDGLPVVIVAIAGVVINVIATYTLSKADRESLNVEGAYQHVLTDLAAFVLTAVAGLSILTTGFTRADGLAALIIAALMLRSGWGLLRDSGRVLLEAAPQGISPSSVTEELAQVNGIVELHDVHVWELTSGFPALSAHAVVEPGADCHRARSALARVAQTFGIGHSTIQVEHAAIAGVSTICCDGGCTTPVPGMGTST